MGGADIVSGMEMGDIAGLRRRQKIESLADSLRAVFGERACDVARHQYDAAAAGSETAEAWRLILERLLMVAGPEQEDEAGPDPKPL